MNQRTGTLGAVVHPRALRGPRADLWQAALARLRERTVVTCVDTMGDGGDADRIARLIADARPSVVIAVGGDGTVREVVSGLLADPASTPPALAIVPFGTANNVARSLGLLAVRQRGAAALERAVGAMLDGVERDLDVGQVGTQIFVGSFAVGMDGAILVARNRWRRRWRLGPRASGYPLYLVSCAVNLVRHRGVHGRLRFDCERFGGPIHNLLITNTALYAGEFRFDADDHSADGLLDLHVFGTSVDYVRGFVAAWRRHLGGQGGRPIAPPAGLRRFERIEIALARPMPSQLDGEEHVCADRFEVRVVPRALRVCVPASAGAVRRVEAGLEPSDPRAKEATHPS